MPDETGPPGSSPTEILADVREAFEQFEDAISTADAARCRPYVSDQLYQDVVAMITNLSSRGRRRVHGSFEIVDATLVDHDAGDPIHVRIHATSSIMELDRRGTIVSGTPELMSWQQDVTVGYHDAPAADHHWVITALGEMSVPGGISGPAGQPMDAATVQELEARQREREEETDESFGRLHRVHVSLMSYFQYHPF